MKPLLVLVLLLVPILAQAQTTASRVRSGTELPATCNAGPPVTDLYFRTDINVLFTCGSGGTWGAPSGSGTVTSVGLSTNAPFLSVAGSPVIGAGTLTVDLTTGLPANQALLTPDGTTGVVGLRSLVANDIPALAASKITTGTFTTDRIVATPSNNRCLRIDATGNIVVATDDCGVGTGTGNVAGPASAVDSQIAVFDGPTGKIIKDGGVTIQGLNSMVATLTNKTIVEPIIASFVNARHDHIDPVDEFGVVQPTGGGGGTLSTAAITSGVFPTALIVATPVDNRCLRIDDTGKIVVHTADCGAGAGGSGDVVGPPSAVDSRFALFDGITGKLLKDGGITIAGLNSSIATLLNKTIDGDDNTIQDLPGTVFKVGAVVTAANLITGTATPSRCLRVDATGNIVVHSADCSAAGGGDMTLADAQVVTGDKIFNAGKLIIGGAASDPSPVVVGALYRNTTTQALLVGVEGGVDPDFWGEVFVAGLSGPVSRPFGGTGAALADPVVDSIMFFDVSAGTVDWLTIGSGLSLAGKVLSATGSGAGDVTAAANLTDTAIIVGDGGVKGIKTSLVTIDANGNISTPGTIITGLGSGEAGFQGLVAGTAHAIVADTVGLTVGASVVGYNYQYPGAAGTGVLYWTNNANLLTATFHPKSGTGTVLASVTGATTSGDCVEFDVNGNLVAAGAPCGTGGSGLTSLGGQTGATQTFANDTNVTISSATNVHTLGWTGTLAKARTLATTVYTDQANTFGAFLQKFQAGVNFELADPTDTTKLARFDLSNIATATARIVTIPNAASTTLQPLTCAGTDKVSAISALGVITCSADQEAAGGGISTLNTLTAATQTFSKVDDTNVTLTISSVTADHAFTLGWAGTLAKTRTLATTVYTDQANTFGAFLQKFQVGANFELADPTDTSKLVRFDASGITTATTRTVTIANANSTTVISDAGAANNFLTAISAAGVVSKAQPAFSNLSGSATDAQVPDTLTLTAISNLTGNGFVKTSGGTGALSIDTTTYATTAAASETVAGLIEIATTAEINTGTDTGRAVAPDQFAASNWGLQTIQLVVVNYTADTSTGNGKDYFVIPSKLAGMNLVAVRANVVTAGTTGTTTISLTRCAAAATGNMCSGTTAAMLSTALTIDSGENSSDDAAVPAVINTANDDVQGAQVIRVNIDAISTTPAKGLILTLSFRLP